MAAAAVLLLCGAQLAAGADCPADGTGTTHSNSVFDAVAVEGAATSGPKLPDISSRPMRSYGAVGSCSGSADDGSFDGGEIVVAATIPLHGPQSSKSCKCSRSLCVFFRRSSKQRLHRRADHAIHGRVVPGLG